MASSAAFNWQNPILVKDIYPFRLQKLKDVLLWNYEIELWSRLKNASRTDPALLARLQSLAEAVRQERSRLLVELERAIVDLQKSDKWFAMKSSRRAQIYYLDDRIHYWTEKAAERTAWQKREQTRASWYPEGSVLHERYKTRALELETSIEDATRDLGVLRRLRDLFEKVDRLPEPKGLDQIDNKTAALWELSEYERTLNGLDQEGLLKLLFELFDRVPALFPKWLQYVIVHFSGMRYQSAHGSWADPRYLLQLLITEDINTEVNAFSDQDVLLATEKAVSELEQAKQSNPDPIRTRSIDQKLSRLRAGNPRRTLLEYRIEQAVNRTAGLKEEQILEELRKQRIQAGDEIPDWVWAEIVKFTPLRLDTTDPAWESISPERWEWQNHRWKEMMDAWQTKDITGWRKQHGETLSLIVTRSVCNEIAENIQHMRGHTPGAGLTTKPIWYMNQEKKSQGLPAGGETSFFLQGPRDTNFKNGASILWLEWVTTKPNAWQVAHPIARFNFLPPGITAGQGTGGSVDANGWRYQLVDNAYIRTRKRDIKSELEARRAALKAQGVNSKEIDKQVEELRKQLAQTASETQYLRWRHEATVVSIVEMIDGRYVLTFETGQIGLIRRSLSNLAANPLVFVGYVPARQDLPADLDERLDEMLRRDLILPGVPLAPA